MRLLQVAIGRPQHSKARRSTYSVRRQERDLPRMPLLPREALLRRLDYSDVAIIKLPPVDWTAQTNPFRIPDLPKSEGFGSMGPRQIRPRRCQIVYVLRTLSVLRTTYTSFPRLALGDVSQGVCL